MSFINFIKKKKQNDWTDLVSVRFGHSSVSDLSIRWFHRTGIGMEDEVRMPASAHSVGATVGTVSSAAVGWVGSGEVLHTPTHSQLLAACRWLSISVFCGF